MTTYSYIFLQTSDYVADPPAGLGKKFGAQMMSPIYRKAQNIRETLAGTPDVTFGSTPKIFRYMLRCPYTVTDTTWGTYADLLTFYLLTNPNATPSSILTLTDHFGTVFSTVYFIGQFQPQPVSVILEGANSWMMVQSDFYISP